MSSVKFTHDDINRLRAEAMQSQNPMQQRPNIQQVMAQLKGVKKTK